MLSYRLNIVFSCQRDGTKRRCSYLGGSRSATSSCACAVARAVALLGLPRDILQPAHTIRLCSSLGHQQATHAVMACNPISGH